MSATKNQYVVTAYIKDKRGRTLSMGRNSYTKTHPKMVSLGERVGFKNQEKTMLHAEVDAINKCRELSRAYIIEVYVYSTRSNTYRKSKPCPICTLDIKLAGIPYVTYRNRKGTKVTIASEKL